MMKNIKLFISFSTAMFAITWAYSFDANDIYSKYPEILYLADSDVKFTHERFASEKGSFSKQLFGKQYIEFDRTLMGMRSLDLFLKGDFDAYQEFTGFGKNNLSEQSFQKIHTLFINLLNSKLGRCSSEEILEAIKVEQILSDIGKSTKAKSTFEVQGIIAEDHDDFYAHLIQFLNKNPKFSPSFNKLTPKARDLILKTVSVAHYGHITHTEGRPEMFASIKEFLDNHPKDGKYYIIFNFIGHIFDVAGAAGHVNTSYSVVYNENTHKALMATLDSCLFLQDLNKNINDAYDYYLKTRSKLLNLNHNDIEGMVLTRLSCMLRLFVPEEAQKLKNAFAQIPENRRYKILQQFYTKESNFDNPVHTYIPAVLVNFQDIEKAITIGLPFVSRTLEKYVEIRQNNLINSNIRLNFNLIAGVVKSNPLSLATSDPKINFNGEVSIEVRSVCTI